MFISHQNVLILACNGDQYYFKYYLQKYFVNIKYI